MKKHWIQGIVLILLFTLTTLTIVGITQNGLSHIGFKALYQHNQTYLQAALNQSLTTFAVLSGLKVGLAILEGSELGVGFGIEVGDAVQSAYDYVDIAWRIVLTSSAILVGTQFLLQASSLLGPWFLALTLALIFFIQLGRLVIPKVHRFNRPARDFILFTAILTTALYLMLPLSVWGSSHLSRIITAPSLNRADDDLNQIKRNLFPSADENSTGLFEKLRDAKNHLNQVTQIVTSKTREMSVLVLKIMAGYIFDTIIFPLLLFLLLFHSTRILGAYAFRIQHERSFHDELDQLLGKYFHARSDQ
jgi:predicted PurR-regulated permease PerM